MKERDGLCIKMFFDITYIDANGTIGHTPDYMMVFKKTDPSKESRDFKEGMGIISMERMNPGVKVMSINLVSEKYE